ncbi:unnamed protein product, partial [Notodromas monacha]
RGLADVTRKYATHPFVLSGDSWDKLIHDYPVCMATQTSVDRMYWVANVSESWHGPLSVSIFVPDVELHLAKTVIKFLRRCSPAVADRVSFHFVSDVAHPPVDFSAEADDVDLDCNSIHESITKFVDAGRSEEMMKWRDSMIYPQQLLRNVARQGCLAEYVTLVDVDMIPRPGLAEDLRSFLRKKETQSCEKCAYVLPVYEIAETAGKLPENKADLVKMITAKRARPFHQAYEMLVLGFQFKVLDNAFLSHWGFQVLKTRPKWRAKQQEANNRRLDQYSQEFVAKYHRDPLNLQGYSKKAAKFVIAYVADSVIASDLGAEDIDDDDGADDIFLFDAKRGLADVTRKYATHPFVLSGDSWDKLIHDYPIVLAFILCRMLPHPPVDFSAEEDDVDLDCNSVHESITKFVDAGKYVTLVDVVMIPIPGLAEDLRSFLRKKETQSCEKCAYVLPVYEIAETTGKLPENEADLVKMIAAKSGRPFHEVIIR